MLGKLLRYEFKFYFRIIPPLYLVLAVLSLLLGINGSGFFLDVERGMTVLLPMLWAGMVTALLTVCLVTVIRRFWNNLLRDEAYLTLTLPVPAWALVAAKAVTALCMFLITALVVALFMLVAGAIDNFEQMVEFVRIQYGSLSRFGAGIVVAGILTGLVFIVQQLCLIYAVLTASRILPRFSGIAAWAAYLAVQIAVIQPATQAVSAAFNRTPAVSNLLVLCLVEAAFAALFFWVSTLLLRRTVNLE